MADALETQSFQGVISEIPLISVDYFIQVQSTLAMFLSHCHADHMKGLDSHDLYQTLQVKKGVYIYCSEVTKEILSKWSGLKENYSKLNPYLKTLEINQTSKIDLPNSTDRNDDSTNSFCVSLIPTAHCPGSVMFFFEGSFGTVLYTGDFRIDGEINKFQALMANPSRPEYGLKTIDHIYLDCTFCCDVAKTFPSRTTSVDVTINLISEWIAQGRDHKVLFSLAGRGFGAEYVFLEVHRRLKMKVHVSKFKHNIYKTIPKIQSAITCSGYSTSIHACIDNMVLPKKYPPCFTDSSKLLVIRLTTQWHLMDGKNVENRVVVYEQGMHRVLYSMHSSLEEIQDFVQSLKPRVVTPIAKPDSVSHHEIAQLLDCEVAMAVGRINAHHRNAV